MTDPIPEEKYDTIDLDAIRERHLPATCSPELPERDCFACAEPYPCDAIQLCDEVVRLNGLVMSLKLYPPRCCSGAY